MQWMTIFMRRGVQWRETSNLKDHWMRIASRLSGMLTTLRTVNQLEIDACGLSREESWLRLEPLGPHFLKI